jgi:hypothetical protein
MSILTLALTAEAVFLALAAKRTCIVHKLWIAATAAVALATASAIADPVQTAGSNINVTTCRAQMDLPQLRIAYANSATVAATEVDFEVIGPAGTIENVTDRGTFNPKQPIDHVFALPQDVSPLGLSSARCIVTKVAYADGTTWINKSPP